MKKHCERCNDTGVVYKFEYNGDDYGCRRVRRSCPACSQLGVNAGPIYLDERPVQMSIDLNVVENDIISKTNKAIIKMGRGNGKYNSTIAALKKQLESYDEPIVLNISTLSAAELSFRKEMNLDALNKWKEDRGGQTNGYDET